MTHPDPAPSPLVIVSASCGRAPVCPFCRDGFAPGAALERCERCGTAHHLECAGLHGGRCCVFGCLGRCGTDLTRAPVFALVLRPGAADTAELAAALGRWAGLEPYDARLRLRHPLPQVAGFLPRIELERAARELERLGARPFAVAPAELVPERPLAVRAVGRAGPRRLTLTLSGRGEDELDLDQPRLVVRARVTEGEVTRGKDRMRKDGRVVRQKAGRTVHIRRVHHVYRAGDPRPLAFSTGRLTDYRFLGDAMDVSANANFARLGDLLSEGAASTDVLLGLHGEARVTQTPGGRRTSDHAWVLAASRLLFLAHDAPARAPTKHGA